MLQLRAGSWGLMIQVQLTVEVNEECRTVA